MLAKSTLDSNVGVNCTRNTHTPVVDFCLKWIMLPCYRTPLLYT